MEKHPKLKFAYCALALAIAGNSVAAEKEANNNNIEEVVSWGTVVNSSSVVLDEENIEIRQPDHISDLLRTIPGVDVGGAHSLNQRITIRSMDDKDIDITIDGARQNTYMYHHMGNLQIHADILKSVDVAVGKNSVVNGGLGGAVRFETKEAKELLKPGQNWGGRVQAQVTSNASNAFAISTYGQIADTVDLLGYFNLVDRDNFEVGGGKIKDENGDVVDGTDGEVRGLEGKLTDVLLKAGWNISDVHRVALSYEKYKDKGDYSYRPDMGLATDLAIAGGLNIPVVYPTEFTRDTVNLSYLGNFSDHTTLKVALYNNKSTLWRDERDLAGSPVPFIAAAAAINEGEAKNNGLNILATTSLGDSVKHDLTYGIDAVNYDTSYVVDGEEKSTESKEMRSVFIEDRISIGNFVLIPGVRYDSADLESTLVEEKFTNTSAALAAEYYITEQLAVTASGTQLWKSPEIGEVFTGAGLNDAANPDIESEEGLNKEIGIHYAQDGWLAGLTYFQTDVDNYIYDNARIPGSPSPSATWKANIGDISLDGFEAYAGYKLNQLNVMLTFSRSESELSAYNDYVQYDKASLDRTQGDTISLVADYEFGDSGVSLHWDTLWVDSVDDYIDLDNSTTDTNNAKDSYAVHNISVRWQLKQVDGLSLTFGIDNLLDEYYASQSSRTGVATHPFFGPLYLQDYEPGRNVKATVAYQF